jgi:hypothetical protein
MATFAHVWWQRGYSRRLREIYGGGFVVGESDDHVAAVGAALTELSRGEGASVERVMSSAGRPLRDLAQFPAAWPVDLQSRALIKLLDESITRLPDARQRQSTRVVLALDPDFPGDSANQRLLRLLAARPGQAESTRALRDYWYRARADLASILGEMIHEANTRGSWEKFRGSSARFVSDASAPPLHFDRCDVLWRFQGRVGIEQTTYRWVTALADGVDRYDAVGWYYSDPRAVVTIQAIANCEVGEIRRMRRGGSRATLMLPRRLMSGESCFFASRVLFQSSEECAPIVSHEVRANGVGRLVMRIQFDPDDPPQRPWCFNSATETDVESESAEDPDGRLEISALGYVQADFRDCLHGRRYGVAWQWAEGAEDVGVVDLE